LGNALLLGHSLAEFSLFSVFSHGFSQTPTRYHGKEVKRRQGVLKSKMPVATFQFLKCLTVYEGQIPLDKVH
jgi:hypothetical protein